MNIETFLHTSRPVEAPLTSIYESPELHDPYSDLNLFLAQKIKEELKGGGAEKKWSAQTQEKLIEKISPEFKRRFPYYRLGVAALKKIWEKVVYFAEALETQKEALSQEGKVNLGFLIRENLKQLVSSKKTFSFHPYLFAQQLALKITECLATYEGTRPVLRHITTLIWAAQRHLIPPVATKENPYDEFDACDKLILKRMLEALGKNPHLTQEELQTHVRRSLQALPCLLQEEIAHILIDNPEQSIEEALPQARQFLTQAKTLLASLHPVELEHKITLWTVQGDLVFRLVRIEDSPLLQLLQEQEGKSLREILHSYLRKYPQLRDFALQIATRVHILSRYIWYNLRSSPEESSIALFFKWHLKRLRGPDKIDQLEEICRQKLPLIPFDRRVAEKINKVL